LAGALGMARRMNEAAWLTSEDPERMYRATENKRRGKPPRAVWTRRKEAFFGAACCRLIWPLVVLDKRCRRVVEYNERQFDRPLPPRKEEELYWNAKQAAEDPANETTPFLLEAANVVYDSGHPGLLIPDILRWFQGWGDQRERLRQMAAIMRDVVGNPFRPTAIQAGWLPPTVVALARQIYDSRDFSAMPVLADALEDAGCDNEDVLQHCRGPGPHYLGCWLVDLVLAKE
jgi:hypothetical protein